MRSLKSFIERDEYLCKTINDMKSEIFVTENNIKHLKELLVKLESECLSNRKDYYLQANKTIPPKFVK